MDPIRSEDLERLRDVLKKHDVEYLFLGKIGAVLQGYPDTTQDADLFVAKDPKNARQLTAALRELGFGLTQADEKDIRSGKDFIQLRNGPFDVDLVHAPDGIERYEDARRRAKDAGGFPVCAMTDIIESKARANRAKDRESLARLRDFARYQERNPPSHVRPLPPRTTRGPSESSDSAVPPAARPRRSRGAAEAAARWTRNKTGDGYEH